MSLHTVTAEEIKSVLQNYRPGRLEPEAGLRPAAVLVPLYPTSDGLAMVFTKRTEKVFKHSGQISFPGGMIDPGDITREHAALRETQEEIGVKPENVEVWGRLDEQVTVTRISIAPFVGLVKHPCEFIINTDEIERLIISPVAHFLDPANSELAWHEYEGRRYQVIKYHYRGDVIWGATGRILTNLLDLLRQ